MKNNFLSTILLAILLFFSCSDHKKNKQVVDIESKEDEYHILGTLKNLADSTWIYLREDNKIADSTLIINEKFEFRGSVDEPSFFFFVVGKTNREYFSLWAENLKIIVEGEKGNLKKAIIIAGLTQKENDVFNKKIDSLDIVFKKVIDQLQSPDADKMSKEVRANLIKKQNDLLTQMNQKGLEFVKEFPDSYVSGDLLQVYNTTWDKKTVEDLYDNLSDRIKSSKNGKVIERFLSLPETPKIGEKYIDFELPNTTAELVKLSDIKGKYILVEFWASWCAPCRAANPKLIKNYNSYKEKGFNIIGVSIDQKEKDWIKAIKDDKLPWKQGVDLKGFKSDIALTYGINGIPDNFLIDEKGKIVAKTLRGNQLENKLKELFTSTTNN
ncbi:redoxin domain-containing protein [Aquimarina sp. M1]